MARPDRWSQERIDLLRELHAAGWNSQQIADELGTTRNTVLSKARFLRLVFVRPVSGASPEENAARNKVVVSKLQPVVPARPGRPPPPAPRRSSAVVERETAVRRLWEAKKSTGETADELGTSRGAVIRVLRRMGLEPRGRVVPPTKAGSGGGGPASGEKISAPAAVPETIEPDSPGVELLALRRGACRWAVGESENGAHLFCGRLTVADPALRHQVGALETSYCARHAAMARGPRAVRRAKVGV